MEAKAKVMKDMLEALEKLPSEARVFQEQQGGLPIKIKDMKLSVNCLEEMKNTRRKY